MKNFLTIFIVTILIVIITPVAVWAREFPEPTGFVNDYANIYSTEFKASLESQLVQLEKDTGAELAVVTINSLEGDYIENTAVDLFEQWGIGKADKDNGLLLLIAFEDREIRIEVGYGLESVITDAIAGRIIRNQLTPNFKKEDYETGTQAAVDQLTGLIRGDIAFQPENQLNPAELLDVDFMPIAFILGNLLFIYIAAFLSRSKSFYAGGIAGGVIGLIFGLITGFGALFIFFMVLFIFGGLFLDWLFSRNYKSLKKVGRSTSWWASKGGFSSGSHSSGGFGGFSGGSSGGGGASGGW